MGKGYHVHIETDNISFLKMHTKFVKLGLTNNTFFLALYDKSLIGVNPRDEKNLTTLQKAKIVKEIKLNPWYFFREVLMIPEDGGETRFRLDLGTLTQMYLSLNSISVFTTRPRQSGKTVTAMSFYAYVVKFVLKNSKILFLNKHHDDSKENVKRLKDIIDALPKYLQSSSKKDNKAKEKLFFATQKNTVVAKPSATNPKMADKLGRGLTTPMLYFDEFAFLAYNKTIKDAAIFAFAKSSKNAEKYGKIFGVLITTTPNSIDTPEGGYAYQLKEKSAQWSIPMFDWPIDKVKEYIKSTGQSIFMNFEYSYKELDLTEEWLEEQKRLVEYDKLKINREILLIWPKSFDNSPFSEEELESIYDNIKYPLYDKTFLRRWTFKIYDHIDPYHYYSTGVDVAGGLGSDRSAITLIDPDTGKTVAVFYSNRIKIPQLKDLIVEIMTNWVKGAFINIERNNYGLSIIDTILSENNKIKDRLFYYFPEDENRAKSGEKKNGKTKDNSEKKRVYGWNTNTISRKNMFEELFNIIDTKPDSIVSELIYKEIKTLEYKRGDKIEHMSNAHDDILFSYMLANIALKVTTHKSFIRKAKKRKRELLKHATGEKYNSNAEKILSINKGKYNKNVNNNENNIAKRKQSIFGFNKGKYNKRRKII